MKKVTDQILFVPLTDQATPSHNPQELYLAAKDLNVKAKACASFEEAFELAKTLVDERDGLITISGSDELISKYWHLRGIKKF